MKNSILFIEGTDGFIPKAIEKKLTDADFDIICIPDQLDIISEHQREAQMLLYYLPPSVEQSGRVLQYLAELCRNEHKTLTLAGEPFQITKAKESEDSGQVSAFFQRPIDIDALVENMQKLSASHDEFTRPKSILVIDDDHDFLQVISKWLTPEYKVVTMRSGEEALAYLERVRPDLILLDYEMPELDGYQVLDHVRRNPLTSRVPIIFLTGQNDKNSVMRILQRKPDGYLLKSTCKDELLDTLNRFFADSILNQKTLRHP